MEFIDKEVAETTYDIRLTESELGTIIVALGDIGFDNLKKENRNYDCPYKIVSTPTEIDTLIDELVTVID